MLIEGDENVLQPEPSILDQVRVLEPDLKRALYTAFEAAGATKAALYMATTFGADDGFELVTSYAFNPPDRRMLTMKDPLVQRLISSKAPVIMNAFIADRHLAEVLFRYNNERLVAVPVFGRAKRMIGFLDLRDKAGRKDFDSQDVEAAERISRDVVKILAARNLYALGRLPLVEMPRRSSRSSSAGWSAARVAIAKHSEVDFPTPTMVSKGAIDVIRRAHARMQHRDLTDRHRRMLTAEEFERASVLLPAVLAVPDLIAAALTTMTDGEQQLIVSHGAPTAAAVTLLRNQIERWSGISLTEPPKNLVVSGACASVTPERLRAVASSQIAARVVERLVLTVAFERSPDDAARRQVEQFAERLGEAVEGMIGKSDLQGQRLAMAERLLEPDFNKYPGLADHCRLVAKTAARFAAVAGLSTHEVETVRIAALVHDVALRLLDYDAMTETKTLSEEQVRAVNEHSLVGAALVEPILGTDVALAVLRHHERPDGKGYPGRILGDRIPTTAKIIAIADAWVAMTSPWPYIEARATGDAMARLREAAGSQFDATLVNTFIDAHETIIDAGE
jgi:HD superfamily phosphohydrolase YqeK